jgi:FkbM family methyltransferase
LEVRILHGPLAGWLKSPAGLLWRDRNPGHVVGERLMLLLAIGDRCGVDLTALAEDLVFDVGLHRGEDSAYYLRKGFRVVAFEANPSLIREARTRFADELVSGQMLIVEGAVDDQARETVRFFVHPQQSVWGTTSEAWAIRNAGGTRCVAVEVATVEFAQAIREFGVPYYMKIDIEGADRICLESLRQFRNRPRYMSIESEKADWQALEAEFDVLESLGYRRFAVCQQSGMSKRELDTRTRSGERFHHRFEEGSSGPFGEDIAEMWTDRAAAMRRYTSIFRRYRMFGDHSVFGRSRRGRVLRRALSVGLQRPMPGWYDTHASR